MKNRLPRPISPELLEALWRDPKARSRNRNFSRFRDDRFYRNAVKHVRTLLSFRQDLMKYKGASAVIVEWMTAGKIAKITLRIPSLRLERKLFISSAELELLRNDPAWDEAKVVFLEMK